MPSAWYRREVAEHNRALGAAMPLETVYTGDHGLTIEQLNDRARYEILIARQREEDHDQEA